MNVDEDEKIDEIRLRRISVSKVVLEKVVDCKKMEFKAEISITGDDFTVEKRRGEKKNERNKPELKNCNKDGLVSKEIET